MPQPLIAGLPPNVGLWAGCVVQLNALDPTTGNQITGVSVSGVSLTVRNLTGGDISSGPFMLVPGPGTG